MVEEAEQAPDGIDRDGVEGWFSDNVEGVELPLSFERIAGGRSNLTYSVSDAAGSRWALRRPPLGKALGSAHDMGREHKVVSGLASTAVPVPTVAGFCSDVAVNGAPFYVMDFLAGPVLRSSAEAEPFDLDERRQIGERVVDTLVLLHEVDPDSAGLGDLGKKTDYVARTLKRWSGQWEKSKTREMPLVEEVHDRLAARIPEQGPAAIVHGDYRLDNMILEPNPVEVAACRRLGALHARRPARRRRPAVGLLGRGGRRSAAAVPSRRRWRRDSPQPRAGAGSGYAERSGRDLSARSTSTWRSVTGSWRSSSKGVYARYSGGQYGSADAGQEEAEELRAHGRAARRGRRVGAWAAVVNRPERARGGPFVQTGFGVAHPRSADW